MKSVHWLELSKNSFLGDSAAQTRGPAYYGIQVFSHIAESGAEFVDTTSSNGNIEVHSTRLPDGRVGITDRELELVGKLECECQYRGCVVGCVGNDVALRRKPNDPTADLAVERLRKHVCLNVPFQSILAVLINAAPYPPGDFNQNGIVDAADYVVWRKSLGTPGEYDLWRSHYGQTAAGSGTTASVMVFEPSQCLIAMATFAAPWQPLLAENAVESN